MEALLNVLLSLGVKRYMQVGAMYDMVPHTRPMLVSGSSTDTETQKWLEERYSVRRSTYEGPTSIMTTLNQAAAARGIEYVSLLARLPQYAPLEEDYSGKLRMLEALCDMYHFQIDLHDLRERSEQQIVHMTSAVDANPQLRRAVEQLEERYDRRQRRRQAQMQQTEGGAATTEQQEPPPLPPAIEQFLRELGNTQ